MSVHKNRALWLILLIAFLLRIPGLPWGIIHKDGFEPDEGQHVAIGKNFIHTFDTQYIKTPELRPLSWHGRALGVQEVIIGYPFLKLLNLPSYFLLGFGRVLSIMYSLLLIWLVYKITFNMFRDEKTALLAALLLSIFDLNITYSHYGVPDIPRVFWAYCAVFSIWLYYRHHTKSPRKDYKWLVLVMPMSAVMAFATKFDVIPLVLMFSAQIVLFYNKKLDLKDFLYSNILFIVLVLGFFYIAVGFDYNIADAIRSVHVLFEDSQNVVRNDHHLLYNPILYLSAVIAGTSLPVFVVFLVSLVFLLKSKHEEYWTANLWFLFYVILSFVILWNGDATFVRRANEFLPYIAIVTAHGLTRFLRTKRLHWGSRLRLGLVAFVIIYTLGLSIFSQYHFLTDNRYEACKYLKTHVAKGEKVIYSKYAKTKCMPDGINLMDIKGDTAPIDADFIVLHESYYGRYTKYFTTPFNERPKCCDEVYHCVYRHCVLIQNLLFEDSGYKLVKRFDITHPYPERILFKHLFGTYETFLGDVLIYKKETAGSNNS